MANLESEEVNIFDALSSLYTLLRKNALAAIVIPVVSVLGAVALSFMAPVTYHSSIVIQTSLLSEKESEIVAREVNFQNVLNESEKDQVAKFWFTILPNDVAHSPASLGSDVLEGLNSPSLESGVLIQISAKVYDSAVFSKLEKSVIALITQNPLVLKRKAERTRYFTKMLETIDHELSGLEEVKNLAESKSYSNYLNPAELFITIVALRKTKSEYLLKMEEISNVRVLKSFKQAISTSPPVVLHYLVGGIVIGVLALALYLFAVSFFSYYRNKAAV